jgi:hypothetical protein
MVKLDIDHPEIRQMAARALRNVRQGRIFPRRDWSYANETHARARDYISLYLEHDGHYDPVDYQRKLAYLIRRFNTAIARSFNH